MSPFERENPPARVDNLVPRRAPKSRAAVISNSKQGQCYKLLDRHFQRGEFSFKQLVRQGDLAIYSQTWRGCSEPSIVFEVVCVRRHNGKVIKGQWFEPSEFYPSSSEWGKYGFSFTPKDAAFAKLREISGRPSRNRKEQACEQ
jgi:hypothetical protein